MAQSFGRDGTSRLRRVLGASALAGFAGLLALAGLSARFEAAYTVAARNTYWRLRIANGCIYAGEDRVARAAQLRLRGAAAPVLSELADVSALIHACERKPPEDAENKRGLEYLRGRAARSTAELIRMQSQIAGLAGPSAALDAESAAGRTLVAQQTWAIEWRPSIRRDPRLAVVLPLWLPALVALAAAVLLRSRRMGFARIPAAAGVRALSYHRGARRARETAPPGAAGGP